jgi:hypothetical protein
MAMSTRHLGLLVPQAKLRETTALIFLPSSKSVVTSKPMLLSVCDASFGVNNVGF